MKAIGITIFSGKLTYNRENILSEPGNDAYLFKRAKRQKIGI